MQYLIAATLAVILISPAAAQVQGADPAFKDAVIETLSSRFNRVVEQDGYVEAQLREQIAKTKAENAELKKQIEDLKSKVPADAK